MKRSTSTLKQLARVSLSGKYGLPIGAYLIIGLLTILPSTLLAFLFDPSDLISVITHQLLINIISLLLSLIVAGYKFMMLNIVRGKEYHLSDLLYTFSHHPDRFLVLNLILMLAGILVSLPFDIMSYSASEYNGTMLTLAGILATSVVSIILNLFFGLANYLLLDNLDMGAIAALKESLRLMKGNKMRLFTIDISFIPLALLCIFTCYIGFLWLFPYMDATDIQFYMDVTGELDQREREKQESEILPENPWNTY